MEILIQNVDSKFLPVFKSLAKSINAKIKVSNLTKFEEELLNEAEELEQMRKDGTLVKFNSVKEFRKAVDSGEI